MIIMPYGWSWPIAAAQRPSRFLAPPKLRAALEAHLTENVTAVSQNEDEKVA